MTRGRLEESAVVRRGYGARADVYLAGNAVVKSFRGRGAFLRTIGKVLVARELRAYARLQGVEGVPACYGRLGDYALVLEYVPGQRLSDLERLPGGLLDKLRALVDRVHARGVASRDLSPSNILIKDGEPHLVDFAVSVTACNALGRLLFPLFRALDIYGVATLKKRWGQPLREDEERLFRQLRWEASVRHFLRKTARALWRAGTTAPHR
jgi:tRNA A-37 threonylcarbamoyl transferase component Bud32